VSCSRFEPLIGELVDGTLDGRPRHDLESHLSSCASCARLVEELLVVRRSARALPVLAPPDSAWPRLESALAAERRAARRQRFSRYLLPLAAAAVLIMAAVAAVIWRQAPAATPAQTAVSAGVDRRATSAELLGSVEAEFALAEQHLEAAVAGLEVLARDRQALDPQVAADLQKSMLVIDQAIGESRVALTAQPLSTQAQDSLFEAFRSKITLLQDTIALINEVRKGNQAEAARIADDMNKL
jgi:anti-sigma factor RsiW